MKTIELNDYCMHELNTKEMNETEGGFVLPILPVSTVIAIIELCNAIEAVKNFRLL